MHRNIFKKINRNVRDFGLGVLIRKSLSSGFKPLFEMRSYYIYRMDLQGQKIAEPHSPEGIEFRWIAPEEEAIIRQIEDLEEWLDGKIAEKLRARARCLVAIRGEEVVGFNLISLDYLHLPVVRLFKLLRPRECSSEQITVHPKFRGRGLGKDLRNAFFMTMKKEGFVRIYGGTEATNTTNIALTQRVGFRIFARARFTSLLGSHRLHISRMR